MMTIAYCVAWFTVAMTFVIAQIDHRAIRR